MVKKEEEVRELRVCLANRGVGGRTLMHLGLGRERERESNLEVNG